MLVQLVNGGKDGSETIVKTSLFGKCLDGTVGGVGFDKGLIVLYREELRKVGVNLDKLRHLFPSKSGLALFGCHGKELTVLIPREPCHVCTQDTVLEGLTILTSHALIPTAEPSHAVDGLFPSKGTADVKYL